VPFNLRGKNGMARKKGQNDFGELEPAGKARSVPTLKGNVARWLSPNLTSEDKAWLAANVNRLPEYICGFLHDAGRGYTVSCKFDQNTDRWLSTIICNDDTDGNFSVAVTGRGSTRINSLYTLAYLVVGVLQWEFTDDDSGASGDFG
jgi:hypothetical protein